MRDELLLSYRFCVPIHFLPMIPDVGLSGSFFVVSAHVQVSPVRHSSMIKRLVEYVPRAISPCAGIQASVPRHVLQSLVKHVQERSHVQEESGAGSTSQAARVRHEVTGHTSLCKCMEQTRFG